MASSARSTDAGRRQAHRPALTGTEARELADHLADGDTLTAALRVIAPGRRPRSGHCSSGERAGPPAAVIAVLRAIEGHGPRQPRSIRSGRCPATWPARTADQFGAPISCAKRPVLGHLLDVQLPAVLRPMDGAPRGCPAPGTHRPGLPGHRRGRLAAPFLARRPQRRSPPPAPGDRAADQGSSTDARSAITRSSSPSTTGSCSSPAPTSPGARRTATSSSASSSTTATSPRPSRTRTAPRRGPPLRTRLTSGH